MSSQIPRNRFRVAFSFAGEKRAFVGETAAILAARFGRDAILYDKFHEAEFARPDLALHLPELYRAQADLVVAVLCRDYSGREWCGLEWRVVIALIKEKRGGEILLGRFDHADAPGLFGVEGFVELEGKSPREFASLILERLALNENKPREHYSGATPRSPASPPPAPPGKIDLSLRAVLRGVRGDLLGFSYEVVPDSLRVRLPLDRILSQMDSGRVVLKVEEVRDGLPERYRPAFARASAGLEIEVPLSEVLLNLPERPSAGGSGRP